jgi:Arc/MetJ-type ribon-helix-helix transcriptional regulator
LEKELQGESASMSDVVREALDAYFERSKQSEAIPEEATVRAKKELGEL